MKYILDNNGYVESASCNPISCDDKVSQEYTGTIPSGYDSLDDWILNANIRAYKITSGNLVYDSARDAELQAEWAKAGRIEDYSTEEQIIGTWIDGKPLYRKVIQSTLPNATTDGTAVAKNISIGTTVDVCFIKNCYYWDDWGGIIPMLWVNGSGHVMRCYADPPANNLVLYNSNVSISGNKFLAIIEYTKK